MIGRKPNADFLGIRSSFDIRYLSITAYEINNGAKTVRRTIQLPRELRNPRKYMHGKGAKMSKTDELFP